MASASSLLSRQRGDRRARLAGVGLAAGDEVGVSRLRAGARTVRPSPTATARTGDRRVDQHPGLPLTGALVTLPALVGVGASLKALTANPRQAAAGSPSRARCRAAVTTELHRALGRVAEHPAEQRERRREAALKPPGQDRQLEELRREAPIRTAIQSGLGRPKRLTLPAAPARRAPGRSSPAGAPGETPPGSEPAHRSCS